MSDNDITVDELKARVLQLEDELGRCERISIANRFAASVMHEVNNPLEAIANLTYLLELDESLSVKSGEYLDILKDQLGVLTHITRTSLSFYRDQSTFRGIDLVGIAQASLKLHAANLTAGKIRVRTRFADRAMSSAIATEMLQIFSNLILNAMEVLPAMSEPALHLRVQRGRHGISVTLADNGPGIAEEIEAKLFEAHVTGKSTGTGIGLWHSQRLVSKHGGRIKVRSSRTPGKSGTVFRVWFPHADVA
jgi:signal transduction histidine kinase